MLFLKKIKLLIVHPVAQLGSRRFTRMTTVTRSLTTFNRSEAMKHPVGGRKLLNIKILLVTWQCIQEERPKNGFLPF